MDEIKQAEISQRLSGTPTEQYDKFGPLGIPGLPLIELIPHIPPFDATVKKYVPPVCLAPICSLIDEAVAPHEGVLKFWFSAPRNHGKTVLLLGTIIKHFAAWPHMGVGYFTHTEKLSFSRSRGVRRVCDEFGWERREDADSQGVFEFPTGGGMIAGTILAAGQGNRFRLAIIDDPYKSAEDANSQAYRDKVIEAIENDILPMLDPNGAILLNHSRFHHDDAVGHYRKISQVSDNLKASERRTAWRGVNVKALSVEDGEEKAVWEGRVSLAQLREIRRENPTKFANQYQGEPRPKEGTLFKDLEGTNTFNWEDRPKDCKGAYGVDLAFSGKTTSRGDWSCCLRMLRVKMPPPLDQYGRVIINPETGKAFSLDKYYITSLVRKQVTAPEFARMMRNELREYNAPMLWHCSGIEKGSADFIKQTIPKLRVQIARVGKYEWATPLSVAWNDGRVLLPKRRERPRDHVGDWYDPFEWTENFSDEVMSFTGLDGENDDQVDAASSAFNLLQVNSSSSVASVNSERRL